MRGIAFLLAAFVPLCLQAQASKEPVDKPGRYQLFQGEYEFVNIKGEIHWTRALFKIDTATGALFVCEGTQTDGKRLNPAQPGKMIQRFYCRHFEGELVVPLE